MDDMSIALALDTFLTAAYLASAATSIMNTSRAKSTRIRNSQEAKSLSFG